MMMTMMMAAADCGGEGYYCAKWAREYMGYCLCTTKDTVSFGLGMLSIAIWCVAEIPQIITNFRKKSISGLSIVFLCTWVIGDLFNLFGCLLETATLPTQYYTALLYTATTLTIVLQALYYGHIYHRLKNIRLLSRIIGRKIHESIGEEKLTNGNDRQASDSILSKDVTAPSSPIPFPSMRRSTSTETETYYMSARSLSTSHTPPMGSFLVQRRDASTEFKNTSEEPLLSDSETTPNLNTKTTLCVVSTVTFLGGCFTTSSMQIRESGTVLEMPKHYILKQLKRKLLQVDVRQLMNSGGGSGKNSELGTYLGWAMAAIYMGGRLPQIRLNIQRGNVEGLNPLMFIFSLLGNGTYVASILVNSLKWSKINPNLPWLVDAGGCVLLDTFILIQFIYFHRRASRYLEIKQGVHSSA